MLKKTVSIGIICFNEESNIYPAYEELSQTINQNKNYNYQLIFVDNGSTDNTRKKIKKIVQQDKRATGIFLSRNFGPEASTQASLDHATGDAYICYEGDAQDPANVILQFIKEWEKGFYLVVGIRTKLDDTTLMTFIRKVYYRIFKAVSNITVPVDAGSFALLDKKVMDAIKSMPEKYRFFRGLRAWVGFKTSYVKYQRRKRQRGESSYNLFEYIHHAERSFFGFSYLPLDIFVYTGFLLVFVSFISLITYLILQIFVNQAINEFIMIQFLIIFFGGIQLLALSIVGKYIQVIVEETKARPVYLIEEIVQHEQAKK